MLACFFWYCFGKTSLHTVKCLYTRTHETLDSYMHIK